MSPNHRGRIKNIRNHMKHPSSALYYPTIEFQNEAFLKRSLLYWDNIKRIVPNGYSPNDSDLVKELVDAGMIKNINVDLGTLNVVANKFLNVVNSNMRPAGLGLNSYDLRGDYSTVTKIHQSKIYYVLRDIFEEMGLKTDNYGFIRMSNDLAGYYMLTLSNEIARKRQIPMATDSREIWDITPTFIENANISETSSDTDGVKCLTSMAITDILPKNVDSLTARDLIKISQSNRDARASLREHIGDVIDRIQTIECEEEALEELKDLRKNIDNEKKEFKSSLKFWKSEECTCCLNLTIPTFATLYSAGSESNVITIGAMLFAMVQYYRNCKLLKKSRNASYQSYLVGLDNMSARSIQTEVALRNQEFIYD